MWSDAGPAIGDVMRRVSGENVGGVDDIFGMLQTRGLCQKIRAALGSRRPDRGKHQELLETLKWNAGFFKLFWNFMENRGHKGDDSRSGKAGPLNITKGHGDL